MSPQHRLTDKNKELETATCAVCGPNTPMKINYRGYVMCRIKWRDDQRKANRVRTAVINPAPWKKLSIDYWGEVSKYMDLQDGRCAICEEDLGDSNKANLDHCHTTNKVRGLLCSGCNFGLGHFKDDAKRLEAAIKYLA